MGHLTNLILPPSPSITYAVRLVIFLSGSINCTLKDNDPLLHCLVIERLLNLWHNCSFVQKQSSISCTIYLCFEKLHYNIFFFHRVNKNSQFIILFFIIFACLYPAGVKACDQTVTLIMLYHQAFFLFNHQSTKEQFGVSVDIAHKVHTYLM